MKVLSRKRKTKTPCLNCGLGNGRCICDLIPKLRLATKIVLVIHTRELKRTTNTGKLALKALTNSEMRIRGESVAPIDLKDLLSPDYESLLFYPSKDAVAVELSAEYIKSLKKPVQLIVPDGSWRQAGKVHIRHKEISHLPRVMLKVSNKARHHLRAEHTEFGMSTLEAVARALGVIEGQEIQSKLLDLYQAKLEQTLKGRGQI
jgi:DTW domain-containing protein